MLETLGMIIACQILAPINALGIPPIGINIKVKDVKRHPPQDVEKVKLSRFTESYFTYDEPRHYPDRTVITYEYRYLGDNHNGSMVIDHEECKVDSWHNSILEEPYGGSGELGLYLVGLPGLILFSPILILNGLIWKLIEKFSGMSRYSLNVYLKIKNQLDEETKLELKRALQRR